MKHWIACSVLATGLLAAGCDSIKQSQIQVLPGRPTGGTAVATVPATERDTVKQVLAQIAARNKFQDRTAVSLQPELICDYRQSTTTWPPPKNPVRIVAWASTNRVVIDLMQRSNEPGEPIAYENLRAEIVAALKEQFGDRVVVMPRGQYATTKVQHSP